VSGWRRLAGAAWRAGSTVSPLPYPPSPSEDVCHGGDVAAGVAEPRGEGVPREKRGAHQRFRSILILSACADLVVARSFTPIAEWAQDVNPALRTKAGVTPTFGTGCFSLAHDMLFDPFRAAGTVDGRS